MWSLDLHPACRYKHTSRLHKLAKERAKQLRALLASLVPRAALVESQEGPWGVGSYHKLRQLAFVVTDIEASTAQAAYDSAAYSLAQEIHDTVSTGQRHGLPELAGMAFAAGPHLPCLLAC